MGELADVTALGASPGIHLLPNPHRPYCSLGCKHYAPIQTIEQGELRLQEIFQSTPLCWHAVDSMNRTYQQVLDIERRRGVEADANNINILQLILNRVVDIAKAVFKGQRTPHDVISYHFLQNYLAPELRVEAINRPLSPLLEKLLRHAVAAEMPCCGNVEQFEEDVKGLLGREWNDIIEGHIEEKEQTAAPEQERLTKILDIADCKQELSILRQLGLHYPPEYDTLVERGFTNLYRYLSKMRTLDSHNKRLEEIQTMSFAQIAQVFLETYKALMQSVTQAVGTDETELILLVGDTGAGKTTTYCALTGQNLKLLQDSSYEVEDAPGTIIGHESSSCTFLPRIQFINGKAIVDLPGLRDTNGWPISSAIEFVLLRLVNKYSSSKILVLESITNDAGRYQGIAELAGRLERVFGTKEKLILGITKYAKDKDFEKKQALRRNREASSSMLRKLMKEIEGNIRRLDKKILKLQKDQEQSVDAQGNQKQSEKLASKLEKTQDQLQEKKESLEEYRRQLDLLSQESQDERDCQKIIEKKEAELCKQMGVALPAHRQTDPFIRFENLESPDTIDNIRTQLFLWITPNHPYASVLDLDPTVKQNIVERFENQLKPSLEFQRRQFKGINDFGANVLRTSLTATVAPKEVGQFLHLRGMDPTLAEEFDKKIYNLCITGFMNAIFSDPKVNYLRQMVKKLAEQRSTWTHEQKTSGIINQWKKLETYILSLCGQFPPDNSDGQWNQLRERYDIKSLEHLHLPQFLRIFLPSKIYKWWQEEIDSDVNIKNLEQNLHLYEKGISDIERDLIGLQQLRAYLDTKDEINKIFRKTTLSFDSSSQFFISIKSLIERVRQESGKEDWDKRVDFLATAFKDSSLHARLNVASSCVITATLVKTFLELELGEENHKIIIKKLGADNSFSVSKGSKNNWPILSFDRSIFSTWNISSELLTPLMCLQLIDCLFKSGVHNRTCSIEDEREREREASRYSEAEPSGCYTCSSSA